MMDSEKNLETKTGKIIYDSNELFQGNREVEILHNQDRYRLLITKANKLILNK